MIIKLVKEIYVSGLYAGYIMKIAAKSADMRLEFGKITLQ
jgi:hypothetical protein